MNASNTPRLAWSGSRGRLWLGDCLETLREMPAASVDSVVTDPPYELGFMGKAWDASGIAFSVDLWREVLRVLKPGGHLLAFGGTRTYHRMTVAIEDAGFEIRDSLHWMYGTGFPKSLDVSKALDAAAGAKREVVGTRPIAYPDSDCWGTPNANATNGGKVGTIGPNGLRRNNAGGMVEVTAPATDLAKQWEGWGTALKPGHEPIVMARKPLIGTVAANVALHGTGALNIDESRIGSDSVGWGGGGRGAADDSTWNSGTTGLKAGEARPIAGRWPSNVLMDEGAAAELDAQSGERPGNSNKSLSLKGRSNQIYGQGMRTAGGMGRNDSGGASRFFYVAKPSRAERGEGNVHPCVKPIALMRYLVRLVTPPGGVVLDPFLGSGTTGIAALQEGFGFVGIERSEEYAGIAVKRLNAVAPAPAATGQLSLLGAA